MKRFVSLLCKSFVLLVLIIAQGAFAQYSRVDERIKTYPKSFSNPQQLAYKIMADFSNNEEKARAAFDWIALNIRYDTGEYDPNNNIAYTYSSAEDQIQKEKQFRQSLVLKTLKSGKAVCEGYASLFTSLCALMGMDAEIVAGTSRNDHSQIGKIPKEGDHAWNAVKINGEWKLVDVTWGAGIVNDNNNFVKIFNDAYFFPVPEKFFLNHFPDDPRWLMTDKTAKEFANQPFYYPGYIKSNYKINIVAGIIKLNKDNPVEFNIENLQSTDRVYYITSPDNMLDMLSVDENNNFQIYPSSKLNGYLTIFINEKPIVSYKLVKNQG